MTFAFVFRPVRWAVPVLLLGAPVVTPAAGQEPPPKLAECLSCHGENGVPTNPDAPVIFGQHQFYLYVQLKDFAEGRRKSEVMTPIASALSRDEMRALATHLSKQPWPQLPRPAGGDEAAARKAIGAGMCVECHQGGFKGDRSGTPRLAGQRPEYLQRTLLAFKTRERANNPAMSSLADSFSEADIVAMARYLAGQ